MKKSLLGLLMGVTYLCCAENAQAQPTCDRDKDLGRYPAAAEAIERWERDRSIRLTEAARERLGQEVCQAFSDVAGVTGLTVTDIDAGSNTSIRIYLDQAIDGEAIGPSLGSMVETNFILNSNPSPPRPRPFGMIEITYRRPVSQLRVGGRSLPPSARLLAEAGAVTIAGFDGSREVCRGTLTVTYGGRTPFAC